MPHDTGMHHEHGIDGHQQAQQQTIEKGLVIGNDQQARRRERLFVALDTYAEQHNENPA